jgi:signal transduction histidine kinase/CheY-like chemotaxis protein
MPESDVRGHLILLADRQIGRSDTLRDAVIAVSDMVGLTIAEERARRVAEQARQAAEQAATAKSQFLANMSHEIRTPMNGVLGMLELLSDTDLDARQLDYVDVARSSAQTLLTIINDILDLSRIEAGKIDIEHVPVRIREVVNSSTALFSGTASMQGVALFTEIADNVPEVVLGDPTRLRQVLTNLIGNAIKFTARGQVTVAVRVAPEAAADTISFEVTDTGIGIPASRLKQIFESFAQADTSTTRRFGGTGLGLAICRHLVTLMSGDISVTSVEGEGTTFAFSLPMPVADDATTAAPDASFAPEKDQVPPSTPALLGGHVLLVEDNAVNRHVGAGMLHRLGIEVTMAEDGQQALEAIAKQNFDLVLMDCQMPVMDGFEATRALRENERAAGTRLPVVALTADAMAGAAEQCYAAGMDAYLAKPYSLDGLGSALEPWLSADVRNAVCQPGQPEQ